MNTEPISRDNHFVPQAMLRKWSKDGASIFAYRLLVSSAKVPEWREAKIKGVAYRRNLYTEVSGNVDSDKFERWCSSIETDGLQSLKLLCQRKRLTRPQWDQAIKLLALQDLRTPTFYRESMVRWQSEVPALLEKTLMGIQEKLENLGPDEKLELEPIANPKLMETMEVNFGESTDGDPEKRKVEVKIGIGRQLWVNTIRHMFLNAIKAPLQHRWSVALPSKGLEWPCTDHPVIKLNLFSSNDYNFTGGWNSPGTELMMPFSPHHMLYTQVGEKRPRRFRFNKNQTRFMQKLILERAERSIFATEPQEWISAQRPRRVDPVAFRDEEEFWGEWHEMQSMR